MRSSLLQPVRNDGQATLSSAKTPFDLETFVSTVFGGDLEPSFYGLSDVGGVGDAQQPGGGGAAVASGDRGAAAGLADALIPSHLHRSR